jgi:hypothetical protein
MRLRTQVIFSCAVLLFAGTAIGQTKAEERVNVVTVCDLVLGQVELNGKTVAILGRFVATDEGEWLVADDCGRQIEANGTASHTSVWLERRASPSSAATSEPPLLNQDLLKAKLVQAAKTTKLTRHVQYRCTAPVTNGKLGQAVCGWPEVQDKWALAYGRVETQGDRSNGYGHLGGAPAQVLVQGPLVFIDEKPTDAAEVQGR